MRGHIKTTQSTHLFYDWFSLCGGILNWRMRPFSKHATLQTLLVDYFARCCSNNGARYWRRNIDWRSFHQFLLITCRVRQRWREGHRAEKSASIALWLQFGQQTLLLFRSSADSASPGAIVTESRENLRLPQQLIPNVYKPKTQFICNQIYFQVYKNLITITKHF